jgi:glycosyltransferase involved in cell wall biosynthesis
MADSAAATLPAVWPFVSVIVPVYDHAEALRACLDALERQTYSAARFEVVVVDNSPAGDLHPLPAAANGRVRSIHEPAPGSYSARNAGIAAARGEVLAFTDADCIPDPGWIEHGVSAVLRHPRAGIVAGRVRLFCRDAMSANAIELFESLLAFEQQEYVESRSFGVTANLFTRHEVLRVVGGFNAALRSRGDQEFGHRIKDAGYDVVYCHDALILHPARRSLAELVHRTRRLAGGEMGLEGVRRAAGRGHRLAYLQGLARDLVPPMRFAARVARSSEVPGLVRKAQVISILVLARWLSAVEKIRLKMGGEPLR